MSITTVNPATGEDLQTYQRHGRAEVERLLARAWSTFTTDWSVRDVDNRATIITRMGEVLDARVDELASLITTEMGKPIAAARAEVEKCAWLCRHYAEHGADYLGGRELDLDDGRADVRYDPLGPILAIMPWNFPLWQAFRFIVPNLLGGNVGLLKHASGVTSCALAIQDVVTATGAPAGVFTTLLIDHDTASDVIADQRVRGVTLTGSEAAGRAVAATAGQHLKPSVMELGGSDPFIVLDDADLGLAVDLAADSRYLNSGQSCINAKRLIVTKANHDEFVDRLQERVTSLVVGDPTHESTDIGPLASADQVDTVAEQVRATLAHHDGGRLVLGGRQPEGPGAYYAPTILDGVSPAAPAGSQEIFGPVAAVMSAPDEDAAVAMANATRFGLGAAILTGDPERGEAMARRIEAGMVFVNGMVASDPRLPFGGIKDSGYGRELSREGAVAFMNTKLVRVVDR